MATLNHIVDETDQFEGFEPLPAGEYKVIIKDSDIMETANGAGTMVKLVYEVVGDPQYDGRTVFDYIIIRHDTSAKAVEIGNKKLNTIGALTGIKHIKDSAQLHGKTMSVLLTIQESDRGKTNSVKKYLPFRGGDQEAPAPQAPAAARTSGKKASFIK
jgi:hypothetical protein